ncbi:MAG: glutamate--tRNA ligase [Alphaproteobacteria bacterium]|jgi:glutamyl-tRNA synthetase|nr:glutamate--tRNA ligase [Alphaproteobacteria bacterium]MBT5859832.1 glutamate--tRNA ligase [Alphaproteobacteria bacterium]
MTVVTRFAPSPTGMLHIGGARTALFNWLFSRHHGGEFLLRVEDTDRERSTPEAVDAIFEGLDWLGLERDREPVYQSHNLARHQELVRQLLAEGKAYHCYTTPDELAEMRDQARAEGRPTGYDGRWRDRDPSDAPPGVTPAIRFKAPIEGQTIIDDQVLGEVRFDSAQLDDMILLRSDGTPTYMLAVVADDHDMGITHVIRGVDHLTNAARQIQLFRALDWEAPEFAHIPLIHGSDGAKLSKRHGALAVGAYREQGFLPAAMRNFLVRLGWSHGDEEVFSKGQMIDLFGLGAVGKSPARFDMDKLLNVNGHYIRQSDDKNLVIAITPLLQGLEVLGFLKIPIIRIESAKLARVEGLMPELKKRARTLVELAENARFLVTTRPIEMIPKAAKLLKGDAPGLLQELLNPLKSLENWSTEALEACVKQFAEANDLKLGTIAQPLRAALTGSNASPGIFDVLAVLGREESLGRIADAASTA